MLRPVDTAVLLKLTLRGAAEMSFSNWPMISISPPQKFTAPVSVQTFRAC